MTQEDSGVRFLLCTPRGTNQSGSNIFIFHGECYVALVCFANVKALLEFSEKISDKKIAKVQFHDAGKIGSKHPHTFIGWVELQPTPPPA